MLGLCLVLLTARADAATGRGTGGAGAVPLPPADTGGGLPPVTPIGVPRPTTPLPTAQVSADGRTAIPPLAAPEPVKNAIYAANQITTKPYRYGGGHRAWKDRGYDCSGSVSYALHGGGLLTSALMSGDFANWGVSGRGTWITLYANTSHVYMVVAELRFDTSARSRTGSRWTTEMRPSDGFAVTHPKGF
jgi:hypothetical protein